MRQLPLRPVLMGFFASAALAAASLQAQQAETPPSLDRLQIDQMLKAPDVRFNATIDAAKPVTFEQVSRGQQIVIRGSQQGGEATACTACHGANGAGNASIGSPRIAGMPAWYLHKQLNDYASGARPNPIMTGIAQQLDEEEKAAAASYYALEDAQSNSEPATETPQASENGKALYFGGQQDRAIPACANCHGAAGYGIKPSVPYIAGQHAVYIQAQLQSWQQNERKNDVNNVMGVVARKMSGEDVAAVSAYLGAQQPLQVQSASPSH